MTVSITRIVLRNGDLQMHVGGCRDIARSHSPRHHGDAPDTVEADTLLDAIIAMDTDMADWFGQTVYDPAPYESPWHVGGVGWAPCFATAVKAAGIEFDNRPWNQESGAQPAAKPSIPA